MSYARVPHERQICHVTKIVPRWRQTCHAMHYGTPRDTDISYHTQKYSARDRYAMPCMIVRRKRQIYHIIRKSTPRETNLPGHMQEYPVRDISHVICDSTSQETDMPGHTQYFPARDRYAISYTIVPCERQICRLIRDSTLRETFMLAPTRL